MENRQFLLESTPRTVVEYPSAAPPWEAQMLCWLAFGEHEALKRVTKRVRILIPAEGKPTFTPRVYPADRRETTLRRPPLGGPNALLASIWRT